VGELLWGKLWGLGARADGRREEEGVGGAGEEGGVGSFGSGSETETDSEIDGVEGFYGVKK
jgi:hypothetical protein